MGTRAYCYVDEKNPLDPVVVLVVHNQELRLSSSELHSLLGELSWASGHLHKARAVRYKNLATKYKEVQDVAEA